MAANNLPYGWIFLEFFLTLQPLMKSVYLYTDRYLSVEDRNGQLTFKIQKYRQREFNNGTTAVRGDDNTADGQTESHGHSDHDG